MVERVLAKDEMGVRFSLAAQRILGLPGESDWEGVGKREFPVEEGFGKPLVSKESEAKRLPGRTTQGFLSQTMDIIESN